MYKKSVFSGMFEHIMLGGMRLASLWDYPLSWERMAFDDNHSFWTEATPNYAPLPFLRGDDNADIAIIGAGFTGVSMAYHFSQRYPEKRVILVDAKTFANGASGRSGGMMLNWLYGVSMTDDALMKRIYDVTKGGIDEIEAIIQRHHMPKTTYNRHGSLRFATSTQSAEAMHAQVEHMQGLGIEMHYLDSSTVKNKLALQGAYGAGYDPSEGQLNGALYLRSLRPILIEQGVQIYENTPVLKIHEETPFRLITPHGEIRAKTIVLATNAYTGKLGYFRKKILPLHTHVFATPPLSPAQRTEIGWGEVSGYADDHVHVAYSSITDDGHIIFGGGSNQSAEYRFNNQSVYANSPHSAKKQLASIYAKMTHYLPKTAQLPMAYRWTGYLDMTFNFSSSIGRMPHNRNILYALGYNGHGVTLGNIAGKVLTDIYSGDDQQWRDLPFYQNNLPPVPLDPFRWMGYKAVNLILS